MLLRPRLVTALAALCLSGLATACSAPARQAIRVPVPTTQASSVVSPVTTTQHAATALPMDQVFVVIERVGDPSRQLPATTRERATQSVQRVIARTGYATTWPERLPTARELTAQRVRGFIIASTIEKIDVAHEGVRTKIACSVSLRVAPWNGTDGGERWEPNTTAIARGSALATTSSHPNQVELATRDCLDSAIQAGASEQLVPFLRRIGDSPR